MPIATTIKMSSSENDTKNHNNEITSTDAAHIHFREPDGPLRNYRCHTCSEVFQSDSLLTVMEHFAGHHTHSRGFHSKCFYCGGKVHKYVVLLDSRGVENSSEISEQEEFFYHDCIRWRLQKDH